MNKSTRAKFPSLSRKNNRKALIYLDGPAGTQVPSSVIDAISSYYKTSNSNTHGAFLTTIETDELIHDTREIVAQFLNADSGKDISFGANMTSLNFMLARALGRYFQPGDEILISQLDHESNRGPWLDLREQGLTVKEIKLNDSGLLDYEDFKEKLSSRTRLVALGVASNFIGTVNNISLVRKLSHEVGALLLLDAVHYAPHFEIDVKELDCDFLLCSAYKFYGPHVGILYSKKGVLDRIATYCLRTAYQMAPYKIETGTLNHAALAGVGASIKFISTFGKGSSLKKKLSNAMANINEHEQKLGRQLYDGISSLKKYSIIGPSFEEDQRAPTVSFTHSRRNPVEICTALGRQNIFAWAGHFYAIKAMEVMGLSPVGGVTRMGISLYTTSKEIDLTLQALALIK